MAIAKSPAPQNAVAGRDRAPNEYFAALMQAMPAVPMAGKVPDIA
jgi:hypothetical protein